MTVPIVQRKGGWFVAHETGWSGPWATERAAKFARAGQYDRANELDREVRK